MQTVIILLTVQALLGAFDNLWHHEITERLPLRRTARAEVGLHAMREFLYAVIFIAIAWWVWHGVWAYVLALLFITEIVITLTDFVIEDQTRKLPKLERVTHTVLAINFGAVLALLVPVLIDWAGRPTASVGVDYGIWSWIMTAFSAGVLLWAIRDIVAAVRHFRPPTWLRDPIRKGAKSEPRTILITGATGFIGRDLTRALLGEGDRVIVLTRDADKAFDLFGPHVGIVTDLKELSPSTRIDGIVNLAGAPILGWPWTRRRKELLRASRIDTTRRVVDLIWALRAKPKVLVSASAIGYYGVRGHSPLHEDANSQDRFQSRLCQDWEAAAMPAESAGVRVVTPRIGLVFGPDGGAFPELVRPVRFGFGAVLGHGRQYVSWIHKHDLIRLLLRLLEDDQLSGPVNATAPVALTQREMTRAMAKHLHRWAWLRVPRVVLRAGLGEMAELLIDGQRVIPAKMLQTSFRFEYPSLEEALPVLLPRGRATAGELEVFYNGACPVCRSEMMHYRDHAARSDAQVEFVDMSENPGALSDYGLLFRHAERRLYARAEDGRLRSGFDAFIAIWDRLPSHRWASRLLRLPGIYRLCHVFYDELLAPSIVRWNHRRRMRIQQGFSSTTFK